MDSRIAEGVRKVLEKILQIKQIDETANFSQAYQLDSLSTLELIAELENELEIRIPNEAVLKISSFREAVRVLEELQNQQKRGLVQ